MAAASAPKDFCVSLTATQSSPTLSVRSVATKQRHTSAVLPQLQDHNLSVLAWIKSVLDFDAAPPYAQTVPDKPYETVGVAVRSESLQRNAFKFLFETLLPWTKLIPRDLLAATDSQPS